MKMIKHILEYNRRTREHRKIIGKTIRYIFNSNVIVNSISITDNSTSVSTSEIKSAKKDKYARSMYCTWYEVTYDSNTTCILINDMKMGYYYSITGRSLDFNVLCMIVHDLIVTNSNISFLLRTDDNNHDMKRLLIDMDVLFPKIITLFNITENKVPKISAIHTDYNVDQPITMFKYTIKPGYYDISSLKNILGIGRLLNIISKYYH